MSGENAGTEAFQAMGNKLKQEVALAKVSSSKSAILAANLSPKAMEYLSRHTTTGLNDINMGGGIPQLKIHSESNSTTNHLVDGTDPEDGQIFYTGSQEAFDTLTVILLSIKKCRLEQDNNGKKYMKANYLLAGVIDKTLQPFMIYVSGMSYKKIWELQEQLKPWVTKREGGIPLSMVKVVLSSKKEKVEQGEFKGQKKNVWKFELLMADSGFPVLEGDDTRLEKLESMTETAESMLDGIIEDKGVTEKEWNLQKKESETMKSNIKETVLEGETVGSTQDDEWSSDEDLDKTDDVPF